MYQNDCDYCKSRINFSNEDGVNFSIERTLDDDNVIVVEDVRQDYCISFSEPIYYCPFCGKKL